MGLLPLTYRRPSYVDSVSIMSDDGTSVSTDMSVGGKSIAEKSTGSQDSVTSSTLSAGIPPGLEFENIIEQGTCPVSCL